MQITISAVGEAMLKNCQVYCTAILRLSNGEEQSLLSEPLWCPWSNVSEATKKLDVPAKVHQAVNVFTSYKGNQNLEVQLFPPKVGIIREMQKRGQYRIVFVATSDRVPSEQFSCIFKWQGYDDVYLARE